MLVRALRVAAPLLLVGCSEDSGPIEPPVPEPVITEISRERIEAGGLLGVRGENFGMDPARITTALNGVPVTFFLFNETYLEVVIPDSTTPGEATIEVTVAGAGTATGRVTVLAPLPPPILNGLSADSVLGDEAFEIRGCHFGTYAADVRVSVGPGGAEVLSAADTVIVARAPRLLAGRFPVAISVRERPSPPGDLAITVVPNVAGDYLLGAASPTLDPCGTGELRRATLEGSAVPVSQSWTFVRVELQGSQFADTLSAANFSALREFADRTELLLLHFSSNFPGGDFAGSLEVTPTVDASCRYRLALRALVEQPGS